MACANMPDLVSSTSSFYHTVDSALELLLQGGIPSARISVRPGGAGREPARIIEQNPKPGTPLTSATAIVLTASGFGFLHSLPSGMWESGGEAVLGTAEFCELMDDPLQKAAFWIRQGARLFDVTPNDMGACARWIELFGINSTDWPTSFWYPLALLLPSLHRLAGSIEGIRAGLKTLLDLPLLDIRRSSKHRFLAQSKYSLLAQRLSRLGIDSIVGDRKEDTVMVIVTIGPVNLETYRKFQIEENARRLESVLRFVMPFHQEYRVSWRVLDPNRYPRLGHEHENATLGVNSYIGPSKVDPS